MIQGKGPKTEQQIEEKHCPLLCTTKRYLHVHPVPFLFFINSLNSFSLIPPTHPPPHFHSRIGLAPNGQTGGTGCGGKAQRAGQVALFGAAVVGHEGGQVVEEDGRACEVDSWEFQKGCAGRGEELEMQ